MPSALSIDPDAVPRPARAGIPVRRVPTDDELVAAIRAQAPGAVDAAYGRHGPALLAESRRLLGGAHHDAEECVQDAFVRAVAALRREPGRAIVLRPWLFRIVRNACADHRRRGGRTTALEPHEAVLAAPWGDPVDVLGAREALAGVIEDVRRLPPRQRAALVLHRVDGRSHAETASALGLSTTATRTLVHRAHAGLQARPSA